MKKTAEKNTTERKVNGTAKLIKLTLEYKWIYLIIIIGILLNIMATVGMSAFTRILIDNYILPMVAEGLPFGEGTVFPSFVRAILTMATIYLCGIVAVTIYSQLTVYVAHKVFLRVRNNMFTHMQTLPLRYFDSNAHGDLMSLYTNDTDTLYDMLSNMPEILNSIIMITAVTVVMLSTSIPLTILAVGITSLIMIIVKKLTKKSSAKFAIRQKNIGKMNGYAEEMLSGQKVVKVFCHEETCSKEFEELNQNTYTSSRDANILSIIVMPIIANLGNIMYVLIAIVGAFMVSAGFSNFYIFGSGAMTIGTIISFMQLSRSFIMPLSNISQMLSSLMLAQAGADRIFTLLGEESEQDEGYVKLIKAEYTKDGELKESTSKNSVWAWSHPHSDGTVTIKEVEGNIELNDLTFGYVPEKTVLHNITLSAQRGERVALVGATGAGKTTITNLINRFYDVSEGKLRYDGININKICKPDLRRAMAVVLQDVNLFTGTVMDNIRYGRLDATDEECIEAAKLANADFFISKLPNGYYTELKGDGSGLSQGQRQLLSIARAAVADPAVMVLDEATSSVDTRTEAQVERGMNSIMHGRTVFIIAHRLSTIRNADKIVVLGGGKILEMGNHDELMALHGQYYSLYTGAFELD